MQTKQQLREQALKHRDRIDPGCEDAESIYPRFFEKVAPKAGDKVALYWPLKGELDTYPLFETLWEKGAATLLPVIQKESRVLRFAEYKPETKLVKGPLGVQQPDHEEADYTDPDIVIVPFLAFDRKGHRLGYGQGFYDATLNDLRTRTKITAVGLGFAQQAVLFTLPIEPHDERLDIIITPQNIYDFRAC